MWPCGTGWVTQHTYACFVHGLATKKVDVLGSCECTYRYSAHAHTHAHTCSETIQYMRTLALHEHTHTRTQHPLTYIRRHMRALYMNMYSAHMLTHLHTHAVCAQLDTHTQTHTRTQVVHTRALHTRTHACAHTTAMHMQCIHETHTRVHTHIRLCTPCLCHTSSSRHCAGAGYQEAAIHPPYSCCRCKARTAATLEQQQQPTAALESSKVPHKP